MIKYKPTYEELKQDAELLLRGFVNKVRCEDCGYRITWASDLEEKEGKPIHKLCCCGKIPEWYNMNLTNVTFEDVMNVWEQLFGDMFPIVTKPHSYIFENFISALAGIKYRKEQYKIQEEAKLKELKARKEVKNK